MYRSPPLEHQGHVSTIFHSVCYLAMSSSQCGPSTLKRTFDINDRTADQTDFYTILLL